VDNENSALKFEKGWNIETGGLNRSLGLTTTEILSSVHPGSVRSLYIMGENPMMSEPNLNHTREEMEACEFIVAQDLFINESGSYADVFLPTVSWAEKDGTFTNTDRRVQRVRKAIEPRGKALPDWQILTRLAKKIEARLGVKNSAYWEYTHPSEILEEMGSLVPEYAGVKYARIEKTGLQHPVYDDDHPGTPDLFLKDFPRGKGKFHPLEYRPNAEMPDDDYPLVLNTGRVLEHWHGGSMTRHSHLDDLYPEALVEIHPADAAPLGITNRDAVRITSRRGSIVLRAKVTAKTTQGVVFIPFHFAESAANELTIDKLDPLALIPEFKSGVVRVTKAREEELSDPVEGKKRGRY
jgi:predicted molibdopterin-dependent oxidoreductase YjgC